MDVALVASSGRRGAVFTSKVPVALLVMLVSWIDVFWTVGCRSSFPVLRVKAEKKRQMPSKLSARMCAYMRTLQLQKSTGFRNSMCLSANFSEAWTGFLSFSLHMNDRVAIGV